MISNQILQTTVDGLKAISRVDFCVIDADGKVAAKTFEDAQNCIADAIAFCFLHAGGLCIDKANQHQQKHDKHLLEYDGEHKPHLPKQFPAPKKELQPILLFLFYRK